MTDWEKRAREFYDKRFYRKNDSAHQIDHADIVYKNMMKINDKLRLQLDTRLIFIVAYLHDIFTYVSREQHHILVRKYALKGTDEFIGSFSKEDRKIISDATYEHRSSGNCSYSNDYSMVIQIADKGAPVLNQYIKRSYKYHSSHETHEVSVREVHHHLNDKFGRKGYGFKCEFYTEYYKEEIETFWKELEDLSLEDIEKVVK